MESYLPITIVIVYFSMLGVIVKRWGGTTDEGLEEFAVASRSFNWSMILFTVLATWFVGATYVAWFGWGVLEGIVTQYTVIYTLGGLVVFYMISPRIWIWGKLHNLYNLPDYIGLRYESKFLMIIVAIAGIIIGAPWQVIAFRVFGYAMNAITYGVIPFNLGMTIIVALVLSYIIYGGMRSVVVTDFIQGIISTVVVVVGILIAIFSLFGGVGKLFQDVALQRPEMLTVQAPNYWSSIILSGIIGAYCWLEIFNRIFLAKSVRELKVLAKGAPIIASLLYIILYIMSIGGSLLPDVAADPEAGFLTMFKMAGGPIMLAFAAIVVIAAEMSSVDSQLTTGGTVFANNVFRELKPDISEKGIVLASRISIAVWVVIALILAMLDLPLLVSIAIYTYEMLVHLFPAIIIGVFWKRGNATGALLGMFVGMAITGYFLIYPGQAETMLGGFGAGMIGFVVNLAIYIIAGLVIKPPAKIDQLFAEVAEKKSSITADWDADRSLPAAHGGQQ